MNTLWMDEVDSTNRWLGNAVRENPCAWVGTVVAARHQTDGRGRYGRSWKTTPGRDLAFSFFYPAPSALPGRMPTLTHATALAIRAYLGSTGLQGAGLKWPNDVLVRGRKIAGILAESAGSHGLIMGVGLNVQLSREDAAALDRPATSILMETGKSMPIAEVLAGLLPLLEEHLDRWTRQGFPAMREEYLEALGGPGTPVLVKRNESPRHGIIRTVLDDGALTVQWQDGPEETLYAAELETPGVFVKTDRTNPG